MYFGQRNNNLVSRFLGDIPQDILSTNISAKNLDEFNDDISKIVEDDWLNA